MGNSCGSGGTGAGSNAPIDIDQLQRDLEKETGGSPEVKVESFTNWGDTQTRNKILAARPTKLEEVQCLVKACRKLGIRIRATGASHSWAPLYSDEGHLLMYMKDLKREDGDQILVIQDSDDPHADKKACVMTGSTTGDLMEVEINQGFCLPCNVILTVVTYGGVAAPVCHGVGKNCQTVSDYISGMRIVDSNGDLREYTKEKDGEEMMRAIQGNFGLFGIIYDITFDVQPMITVETKNEFPTVEQLFYDKDFLKKILDDNWSVEMFWFPFNGISCKEAFESLIEGEIDVGEWDPKKDETWIRLVNPTEDAGSVVPRKVYKMREFKEWTQIALYNVADAILGIGENPRLTPAYLKSGFQQVKDTYGDTLIQQLPNAVHYREHIEKGTVYNMEWAIDCDENYDNVRTVAQGVIDHVLKLSTQGKFPLNLALEMRIMADTNVYLSPALAGSRQCGGSGLTLFVEVVSWHGTPDWPELCQDLADMWIKLPGARPHWAKEWENLNGIEKHLQKMYKENIPKFVDQLAKSGADPDGIFLNETMERILYPKGHTGWKNLQKKLQQERLEAEQKK